MLNSKGLLINNVSNVGNSSNVSNVDNASSNVGGDNATSNESNVVNASCKVSCVDNAITSNADNANISASNVGAGCSNSGEPLFGPADSVELDSPPSSVDMDMVPASGPHKRPVPEPPLEDSSALPGLTPRPVSKKASKSKVSKKNPYGPGHHSLPESVSLAANKASSHGRPPQ